MGFAAKRLSWTRALAIALDVIVDPDGSWRWKGEDHLAELTRLEAFTAADSAALPRDWNA